MKTELRFLLTATVVLLGSHPRKVEAQQAGTKEPVPRENVLSANPFLLLWEWTNVEYERKVSPTGTAGLSGSWISFDEGDEEYRSLNAFYRYYPQGAALTGFYFGGRGGGSTASPIPTRTIRSLASGSRWGTTGSWGPTATSTPGWESGPFVSSVGIWGTLPRPFPPSGC
jgi:hypothetical protein